MKELDSINFEEGYFEDMNGDRVEIHMNYLSPRRYQKYIQFVPMVTFGVNFTELFESNKKIYEATTNGSDLLKGLHVASTESMNNMKAIQALLEDDRRPAVMWMCALFCNYPGEDLTKWDQDEMQKKIDKWDNINIYDFFFLAASCIAGLKEERQKIIEALRKIKSLEKSAT